MDIIKTCLSILHSVVDRGVSFDHACQSIRGERAIVHALCQGVLKNWPRHNVYLSHLLRKPLAKKHHDINYLLRMGLFQLEDGVRPAPVITHELVQACAHINKIWAKSLVNACLRRFLREREGMRERLMSSNDVFRFNQMPWFIHQVQQSHPDGWQSVLEALLNPVGLFVRVNTLAITIDDLLHIWDSEGVKACRLNDHSHYIELLDRPLPSQLPGYHQGWFYVQNPACDHLVKMLPPLDGLSVLEIGAFPGGKTTAVREVDTSQHYWHAIDVSKQRDSRFIENLNRMKCWVDYDVVDATALESPSSYDLVIMDAPCSASGSMRHLVDYHISKKEEDLDHLLDLQAAMLSKVWESVKEGGSLIYITCSIFAQENDDQINTFILRHKDAVIDQSAFFPPMVSRIQDGLYFAQINKKHLSI